MQAKQVVKLGIMAAWVTKSLLSQPYIIHWNTFLNIHTSSLPDNNVSVHA